MLILTRRIGETVIIDGQITLTVLAIHGNCVRLGIIAPKEIEVHREEIFQRIHGENSTASADRESYGSSDSSAVRETSV